MSKNIRLRPAKRNYAGQVNTLAHHARILAWMTECLSSSLPLFETQDWQAFDSLTPDCTDVATRPMKNFLTPIQNGVFDNRFG